MALREIRTFDDEFLHKVSRPVGKADDHVRRLLEDMAETMYHTQSEGGLAACQVGILRRLVVADMGEGLIKLINPRIAESAGEQTVIEGCLSYPGIWGKVIRPEKVVVEALDENGTPIVIHGAGEVAKCLCHEIDHLNGILFTDKIIEHGTMKNGIWIPYTNTKP
jgi:peptide deformylase